MKPEPQSHMYFTVTDNIQVYYEVYGKIENIDSVKSFLKYIYPNDFIDTHVSEWARRYVVNARRWGYVPYYMINDFKANITRKELCDIIYKYCYKRNFLPDSIEDFGFDDCDDEYIRALAALGIINGTGNNKFEPNKEVTRQEAAKIICTTFEIVKKYKKSDEELSDINYEDDNEFADWGRRYIKEAKYYGLFLGIGNNKFGPNQIMTREEVFCALFEKMV